MLFANNYYPQPVIDYGNQVAEVIMHSDNIDSANDLIRLLGSRKLLGKRFLKDCINPSLGWKYHAIFAEILGKYADPGYAMATTIHNDMVLPLIFKYGSSKLQQIADSAINGLSILAHAVTEESSGSDLNQLRTIGVVKNEYTIISGKKCYVSNGLNANYYCCLIKVTTKKSYPFNLAMVLIPANIPGVKITNRHQPFGNTSVPLIDVTFDNVKINNDYLIGGSHAGFIIQTQQFVEERIISSFRATGLAKRIIDYALQYCKQRQLGNAVIYDKQAVRHKFANVHVDLNRCYAMCHRGLNAIIDESKQLVEISSATKYLSSKLVRTAAKLCLQFCGAAGYVENHFATLMLRDSRLFSISTGSDELMFDTILEKMVKPAC